MSEIKNILQKLHAVMKDVSYIQRDGKVDFNPRNKYTYATETVIKEKLHAAFVEHGIVFHLDVADPQKLTDKILTIKCRYSFTDIESCECISGEFVGSGQCGDEKGIYAAVAGAIKYILTSTFLIPTGDDPEKDNNTDNDTKPADTKTKTTSAGGSSSGASSKTEKQLKESLWDQVKKTFAGVVPPDDKAPKFILWLATLYKLEARDYELIEARLTAVGKIEAESLALEFMKTDP